MPGLCLQSESSIIKIELFYVCTLKQIYWPFNLHVHVSWVFGGQRNPVRQLGVQKECWLVILAGIISLLTFFSIISKSKSSNFAITLHFQTLFTCDMASACCCLKWACHKDSCRASWGTCWFALILRLDPTLCCCLCYIQIEIIKFCHLVPPFFLIN